MDTLNKIKKELKDLIINEWMLAGHNLTGSFIDSLEVEYKDGNFNVYGNDYGLILNKGVSPSNIPYQRGSGASSSKYITGLKNYVKQRMGISDERKALSIAFAIAETHKKEGIEGSGFIDEVLEEFNKKIDNLILDLLEEKNNYYGSSK